MTQHLPSEDLRQQYIQRRAEELGKILQCLKTKDFKPIGMMGHRMKGNGISFGYPELSLLGEKIEIAANAEEVSQLRFLSVELANWVDTHALKKVP